MRKITSTILAMALAIPAMGQVQQLKLGETSSVVGEAYDLSNIPPLQNTYGHANAEEFKARAEIREYRREIKTIRHKHFRNLRNEKLRNEGIKQIQEFTDPAAFLPLIDELRKEEDDVRLALLDHFENQGDWGQAALAWINITEHEDQALNYEALKRITAPASDAVLSIIDQGLRSDDDYVANLAGRLAGHLRIYDAIPLLIHGQARGRPVRETGDQAWILVGTQKAFIRALIPVVGDNSGAFIPVPGVLTEGVILRVMEAMAIIYRTEIHYTLVSMTSQDWGGSTASMGYDQGQWLAWYENEYLPHRQEQLLIEKLAGEKGKNG